LLQAVGVVRVFEASLDFKIYLISLNYTKPLVSKYDKEINDIDVKNNRLRENMITLCNMKSVLYVGLIQIASAVVTFFAGVFSKQIQNKNKCRRSFHDAKISKNNKKVVLVIKCLSS